jgi:hypothetical protein
MRPRDMRCGGDMHGPRLVAGVGVLANEQSNLAITTCIREAVCDTACRHAGSSSRDLRTLEKSTTYWRKPTSPPNHQKNSGHDVFDRNRSGAMA